MKSREVGHAFRDGLVAAGGSIVTDGRVVYSYQMMIARKQSDGTVEIIDRKHSPSRTTSKHIGYVEGACSGAKVVQGFGKPGKQ